MSYHPSLFLDREPFDNGPESGSVSLWFPLPLTLVGDLLTQQISAVIFKPCRVIQIADAVIEVRAAGLVEVDRPVIQAVIAAHVPEVIGADRYTIVADGLTSALVTYKHAAAPGLILVTIAGTVTPLTEQEIAPGNGVVQLQVRTDTPQVLTVQIGTKQLQITAVEPPY